MLAFTRALAAPFDLPAMLRSVIDAACRVLHAERCSVRLHDEARGELMRRLSRSVAYRCAAGRNVLTVEIERG